MEYTSIIVEYIIITLTKPVVVFIIIYLIFYYIKKIRRYGRFNLLNLSDMRNYSILLVVTWFRTIFEDVNNEERICLSIKLRHIIYHFDWRRNPGWIIIVWHLEWSWMKKEWIIARFYQGLTYILQNVAVKHI